MYSSHFKANLSFNKLWGKLLDLHPDKENIQLFTQQNRPKWKMNKRTALNLIQTPSLCGLKRKRDDIEDPNLPQICDKIIKIQKENLQKEFTCDLCKDSVLSFASLSPCSHKLCNECLAYFLKYSKTCPLCCKKMKSSTKTIAPQLKISSEENPNSQKEKIFYEDGSFYEGHLKNNKKEGKGRLTLKTGDVYKGVWLDDVLQPLVKIKYLDGNGTYEGEVKDFKRHGKGIFICGETIYEGSWENDRRNGWGKEMNGVFSTYEGHWRNDKQHGHGKLKLNSGVFEGNWINGRISGYGAVSLKAEEKNRRAENQENERQFVKKESQYKKEYEGYWTNGEINGIGTMRYADGSQYRGEWSKNKKEGSGVLVMENGVSIQGRWRNDKIQVDVPVDF